MAALALYQRTQGGKGEPTEDAVPTPSAVPPPRGFDRCTGGVTGAVGRGRRASAEITSAHVEGHNTNTETAFKRLVQMLHSRVEAFGAKWRRWYLRQQCRIGKVVPRDKREKKLMVCASDATYEINNELVKALGETGTNRRTGLEDVDEYKRKDGGSSQPNPHPPPPTPCSPTSLLEIV